MQGSSECVFIRHTGRMCNMIIITPPQSFAAWFLEFIVRLSGPTTTKQPRETFARKLIATRRGPGPDLIRARTQAEAF